MKKNQKCNMDTKKYIGNKEVDSHQIISQSGKDLIEVTFKDGSKDIFSPAMFDKIVTDHAVDATELRDLRIFPVIEEMLHVLLKWNIKVSEIDYIGSLIAGSLNENFKKADDYLWQEKPERERTMIDIENVLQSSNKNQTLKEYLDNQS